MGGLMNYAFHTAVGYVIAGLANSGLPGTKWFCC